MTVLITGASRGIGAALAVVLAGKGHDLLLVSRNRSGLEETRRACEERNPAAGVELLPFDLSDLENLEAEFLGLVRSHTASLDALVNNAGTLLNKPFLQTTPREARHLYETNVLVPSQLIRLLHPLLGESTLKHIVNITSMGGYQGSVKFPGLSHYSASKAALGSLTECLAGEMGPDGFRINALALGAVQTEMLSSAFPGYKAPLDAGEMAEFIAWFVLEGGRYFQGKILPVSLSTP